MKQWMAVFLILILFSGCATIYGRQNDKVDVFFDSSVRATSVTCDGVTVIAPANISLKQSKTHSCSATSEGYSKEKFRVRSRVTKEGFQYSTDINQAKWGKWTLGIGTLIGWSIDFISGAMRTFEQDRYDLELEPSSEVSAAKTVLDETVNVGKSLIQLPKNLADNTTNVVLDTTIRTSAEQVGLASEEKRQAVETKVEGKKILKHLEDKYGEES